jgi:hypothetical protein
MKPRTLLVLLILVGALGAFIWFYERELPSTEERAKLEKKVLQIEKADVTAVTLHSDSGTVRLEKVKLPAPAKEEKKDEEEIDTPTPEDTEWHLRQPLQARADAFAVDGLLDALTGLEQTRVLDDVDPKQAGFDKPRATVRLKTDAGETVLRIGAEDPLGGSTLAAVEGRKGAYVVSDSILNELRKAPGDWRDRQMFRGNRDQVTRITLSSGVVLVAKGEDFQIAKPFPDRADREKVDDLFAELSGLTAERFLDQPLNSRQAAVEVAFQQGPPVRIEVGEPVMETAETPAEAPASPAVQARIGSQVFEARTRLAEIAARPAAEWRSQALSGLDVFEVESATVEDAQGKLELQRAEPDWKRGSETISYLPVSDFLFALVQARAERLLAPGELGIGGKPALTVTLKSKDKGEENLTLYPPVAAGVPARVSGRNLVLLLPAGTLGEIQGKLAEVRKAPPVKK